MGQITPITYKDSGVDIDAGDEMVERIRNSVRRTYSTRVMGPHDAFAGMFRLDYNEKLFKRNYTDPVLVGCTDGVGSKLKVAFMVGDVTTVGIDLVAMNVNDLIVCGAEPLFFLDYLGVGKLEPGRMADIVAGVAEGCVRGDCALLGGETAEMPDFYKPDEFDMAGFAVGVAEMGRVIDGKQIEPGDVVLGLASDGVHSNGYALVRRIVFDRANLKVTDHVEELGETVGAALLRPTRIYVKPVVRVLRKYRVKRPVRGMAHITGGGLEGNVPRCLPAGTGVEIKKGSWPIPPVFDWLARLGPVEEAEMYRVFNMGIGYVMIVRPTFADSIAAQLERDGERVYRIGRVVKSKTQEVRFK
ncbi:MAG: Phosphoribosylformylglycinamidine cyclo-ligase [Phycisphaerae bacterium]|nr:Phosphoribosylformylglycinamidine cyclo-ligase [Phycisphaerae bacterium]